MKCGFIRKFCRLLYHTQCKSFVFTLLCLLCYFGTHFLERSAERALNLGITSAFWDMFGSLRSSTSCESGFHIIACKFSRSPDRPDRTRSDPSDCDRPDHLSHLDLLCFYMIVPFAWSYFEMTGTIIQKPGFTNCRLPG